MFGTDENILFENTTGGLQISVPWEKGKETPVARVYKLEPEAAFGN
jgi:hypothetical protein